MCHLRRSQQNDALFRFKGLFVLFFNKISFSSPPPKIYIELPKTPIKQKRLFCFCSGTFPIIVLFSLHLYGGEDKYKIPAIHLLHVWSVGIIVPNFLTASVSWSSFIFFSGCLLWIFLRLTHCAVIWVTQTLLNLSGVLSDSVYSQIMFPPFAPIFRCPKIALGVGPFHDCLPLLTYNKCLALPCPLPCFVATVWEKKSTVKAVDSVCFALIMDGSPC